MERPPSKYRWVQVAKNDFRMQTWNDQHRDGKYEAKTSRQA